MILISDQYCQSCGEVSFLFDTETQKYICYECGIILTDHNKVYLTTRKYSK